MAISKDSLVDALRLRYDSYSAETVFELACTRAGLEGKTSLEPKEVVAFRAALEKVGDRVGNVLARIDDLAGIAPAKSDPSGKSDGKPENVEAKSDSKPTEAKSDSKPNDSDSKPNEAKSDGKPENVEAKSDSKPTEGKGDSKPNEAKSDGKPTDAKSESKSGKTEGKPDEKRS
jgi:hypothetical protein